jgi:uncharacterized membrane protein YqjE
MPTPGPVDSAPAPGLIGSIRTFWRVLIATFYTRLDLFLIELGEEAYRLVYLVIAAAVGLVCLHTAFFFFMLWILAAVWDTPARLWVIGGICLVYLAVAVGALVFGYRTLKSRPRFLGQTLAELKRDVEGLQTAVKTKETKP